MAEHLGERHFGEQRNEPGNEEIILAGLDDKSQLHRWSGHLDGRLGALILCAIDDVGPVNQLGDRRGVEAKTRGANVRQKAGAGGVVGVEELAAGRGHALLIVEEVLLILRGQKGREVMVEPPGDARRGAVLEIDDGVFVAGEFALVKERAGAMHQAVVLVALAVEARKERGRAGSIEAFVVIEDANLQDLNSLRTQKKRFAGTV